MKDKSIYASAPAYYQYYFDLIESNDLLRELRLNEEEVCNVISEIPDQTWHYAYAEGKWTCAELIRHIIETERVFSYRALRFSRFDQTALPGFDENKFIDALHALKFSQDHILRDFKAVRASTIALFETMNDEMLRFAGNANGLSVTAEMLGYMIVGHTKHHIQVLQDRYVIG